MRLSISISAVTTSLLVCVGYVGAAAPQVHDEANFFKPETILAANKIISDIKRDGNKDFLVETFLRVPEDKQKDAENPDAKTRFFTDWADERAGNAHVDGVYVLICKDPSYLKVVVDNRTAKTFTKEDRDHLDNLLVTNFKSHKYDEGLLAGVQYVQSKFKGEGAHVSGGDNTASRGVTDAGGFFKPETITAANEIINTIKSDDKKDLRIETFLHVPEDKTQEAADPDTKADFFKEWANERGREQKVDGVYVLICKAPPYLKVASDNRTDKIFNEEARNHLSKLLAARFKNKDYDDGLLEGVRYVQTMLKGKTADEQTTGAPASAWPIPGSTGSWPNRRGSSLPGVGFGLGGLLCVGLFVIVAICVVLMVISSLFRAFQRGPGGYGPGGYGPMNPGGYGGYGGGYGGGQGGGGFLSSMLGGMFGGAAGSWGYDRFFGGHQGQTRGGIPREDGAPMPPQQDGGFTGGGGDFGGAGDSGGGADFGGGGGFGGGGDAGGGGDFGGGGGDTGGGGSF